MNSERTVDRQALLDYLTLEAAERPQDVDAEIEAVATSIENLLGPALRQLGTHPAGSEFESEAECLAVVSKLAFLPSLPYSEAGTVCFLREYELLDELGNGGMGTVFRARHAKLGKQFAVKVLSPKLPHNDQTVSRFLHEMRAAGRIEHPNVVCATDAGEVDGVHYLVMEFVDGVNLSQLVKATGPLALDDACEIIRLAALGLQAIHDHGLVHRDIKPSNLMLESREAKAQKQEREDSDSPYAILDSRPCVKILDLGLALLHDASATSVSGAADRVGTTQYMAPEQFADSQNVDARADLYSLGCTLHYLLSGRPPTPDRRAKPGNPEAARLLDRLLATNPADRFASATDVAIAFEPLCSDADLGGLALRVRKVRAAGFDTATSPTETRAFTSNPNRGEARARRRGGLFVATSVLVLMGAMFATWSITGTRSGELVLSINEPHATVLIDGKPAASGPRNASGEVTLRLAVGNHIIQIQADGHQPWSDDIAINSREPAHLVIQLVPNEQQATRTGLPSSMDLDAHERQLAEWVLGRGGSLRLYPRGEISEIAQLPQTPIRIQKVLLSRKNVQDEDIVRFVGMSNLQSLDLSHNQLTAHAGERLARIQTLRWLYLQGNQEIDDGAAEKLRRLHGLESLDLSATRVTDATVANIATLTILRDLRLANTGVTSGSLKHISELTALVRLDLTGTRITDEGLDELRKLPALKYLLLTFTDITDAAVEHLKVLSNLRELNIKGTKLSPASVEEIRRALPQCVVTF